MTPVVPSPSSCSRIQSWPVRPGVEDAVRDVARHLLRADQHAFDLGIVDGRKVRTRAHVDVEAGAREQLDGRVLQRAFRDAELEFHSVKTLNTTRTPGKRISTSVHLVLNEHVEEACALARMTDVAVAEPLDLDEHRVVVAIDQHLDDLEPVAGRLALGPQLVARPAEEGGEAGRLRERERLFVHEADHQDLGALRVLDDRRNQPVELRKVHR